MSRYHVPSHAMSPSVRATGLSDGTSRSAAATATTYPATSRTRAVSHGMSTTFRSSSRAAALRRSVTGGSRRGREPREVGVLEEPTVLRHQLLASGTHRTDRVHQGLAVPLEGLVLTTPDHEDAAVGRGLLDRPPCEAGRVRLVVAL